jgi:hypothetical protein
MEYERALFRVYERCVESLRDEEELPVPHANRSVCTPSRTCRVIEFAIGTTALLMGICLCVLHIQVRNFILACIYLVCGVGWVSS